MNSLSTRLPWTLQNCNGTWGHQNQEQEQDRDKDQDQEQDPGQDLDKNQKQEQGQCQEAVRRFRGYLLGDCSEGIWDMFGSCFCWRGGVRGV